MRNEKASPCKSNLSNGKRLLNRINNTKLPGNQAAINWLLKKLNKGTRERVEFNTNKALPDPDPQKKPVR